MSYGIEACALALLRNDPEVAVPLSRLHEALLREAGPTVGPSGPLEERLRRRPDLFILLEPRPAPWELEEWPERIRNEYRRAIQEAGLTPEPRVVSRAPEPTAREEEDTIETFLQRISNSLIDLWDATEEDPDIRAQIADALGASSALRGALADGTRPEPRRSRSRNPGWGAEP